MNAGGCCAERTALRTVVEEIRVAWPIVRAAAFLLDRTEHDAVARIDTALSQMAVETDATIGHSAPHTKCPGRPWDEHAGDCAGAPDEPPPPNP